MGTGLREALTLVLPPVHLADGARLPLTTLGINVLGALLLGLLLESLGRRGSDAGRRRTVRLLLGTGLLGGFTTYGALAFDSVLLLQNGATGVAMAYGLGSVLFGSVATWFGIVIGAGLHRSRPKETG